MGGTNSTTYCDPALLEEDLTGKVYIVTGGNSGIGLITGAIRSPLIARPHSSSSVTLAIYHE